MQSLTARYNRKSLERGVEPVRALGAGRWCQLDSNRQLRSCAAAHRTGQLHATRRHDKQAVQLLLLLRYHQSRSPAGHATEKSPMLQS